MPIDDATLLRIKQNDPTLTKLRITPPCPLLTPHDIKQLVEAMEEGNNQHLKTLLLQGNAIGDEGAELLSKLKQVQALVLDGNDLTDKGAQALARMSSLKELYIAANDIGNEGLKALLQHPTLQSLDLSENNITQDVLPDIMKNSTLTNLILKRTSLDEDQLGSIQKHLQKNKERLNLKTAAPSAPQSPAALFKKASSSPASSQAQQENSSLLKEEELSKLVGQLTVIITRLEAGKTRDTVIQKIVGDLLALQQSTVDAEPR